VRSFALAVGCLLLATACGHVETHEAMLRPAQPRTVKQVELYMADQPLPARPFYEIAIVQAVGFGNKSGPEDLAEALSARAGSLGCDAVVRTNIDLGYSRGHAAGVCVKFMADGPAARSPVFPQRPTGVQTPPGVPAPLAPRWEPLPSSSPGQGGGR
jgi:hypothetical protein